MREYKFRGKRKDNRKWVCGYYVYDYSKNIHYIVTNELYGAINAGFKSPREAYGLEFYEVDPETVGQYTGLHDKEYKMIYEGDIIKNRYGIGKVVYKDICFITEGNFNFFFEWPDEYFDECSVIGNIHDNPELLEVPDA